MAINTPIIPIDPIIRKTPCQPTIKLSGVIIKFPVILPMLAKNPIHPNAVDLSEVEKNSAANNSPVDQNIENDIFTMKNPIKMNINESNIVETKKNETNDAKMKNNEPIIYMETVK